MKNNQRMSYSRPGRTTGWWLGMLILMLALAGCEKQSADVQEYVDFLYKYMPLPDRADYPREFFERNVASALQARQEMSWGAQLPEREFRHFVLPVRVNNENLDSSRWVLFAELKERLKGLTMQQAILEVNHWCHERVTYRPSDARTSSPLATIRTAYGRCGEESTLLVAALRSVAIPARQVYTPRWAHTDDNHAWVEAWADGQWWFLGACEPEPVLNLGWFNESASRGMLMHTRVFGDYDGPEEVMSRTPCYTEINVTANYAPTSTVIISVVDTLGMPVADALVEFKLYNYAEFYTVAQKTTDAEGRASLTAGRGDLLLWVSKDGLSAQQPVSFDADKTLTLTLGSPTASHPSFLTFPFSCDLDVVPPAVSAQLPQVSAEQRAGNNRRLAREDSIRQAYEATMPVEDWRGNHDVIRRFLDAAPDTALAQRLLKVLSKKDLRDVPLDVLLDNLSAPPHACADSALYDKYVLSPRVENEWLTPYKAFFRQQFPQVSSPEELVAWCRDSLLIDNDHNPQHLRQRPMSTYRERLTDDLGRDIFFVSVARSLGFPARINEVNQKPQYYKDGAWRDVAYDDHLQEHAAPQATLMLDYQPAEHYAAPKYYIHFTLSKLHDGRAQLMTFDEEATWQHDFKGGVQLDEGDYLLTTGTRLASGKVLAHVQSFRLQGGQRTTVTFTMREDDEEPQVIGSLNAENMVSPNPADVSPMVTIASRQTILATTGRGFYVLGIVAPNQEPTNHALRDISICSRELEQWGRPVVLLFESDDDACRFNYKEFSQLPSTVVWAVDADGTVLEEACQQLRLNAASLPVFLVCDTFNRVVFVLQGYTINLGEQLMKTIRRL